MKLIRFGEKGAEKPGIFHKEKRYDCSEYFSDWNHDFFQTGGLEKLKSLLKERTSPLPEVGEQIRWGSPIARPGMIMCVGLNYSDHAKEAGMAIPTEPIIFMKATNTLVGPYDSVTIPKNSTKTDWEVELGIVIGKHTSYLADETAAEAHIAGYCVINDISEREFQIEKGGQWTKGKSCPGFTPCGPFMVSQEEIPDPTNLGMRLKVNGKSMQNGNSNTMIFKPNYIVWYLSQFMEFEAGDLISTGTPPGVGMGMNPPTYIKDGDVVELDIDHLGAQKQVFKAYRG